MEPEQSVTMTAPTAMVERRPVFEQSAFALHLRRNPIFQLLRFIAINLKILKVTALHRG